VSSLRTEDLAVLFLFAGVWVGVGKRGAAEFFIRPGGGGDNAIGWGWGSPRGADLAPAQWELGGLDTEMAMVTRNLKPDEFLPYYSTGLGQFLYS
jgi:hypothetical protein